MTGASAQNGTLGGISLGGWVKSSFCDYPGRVSAVVFTQGCNFRCPFCHNGRLLRMAASTRDLVPEEDVLDHLAARRGRLGGLVVSGGEPTLQPALPAFLRKVKALGHDVKLDTNGSRPAALEALLAEGLLDYVAMDVKAPWRAYDRLTGVRTDTDALRRSVALVAASGVAHHFRTTAVGPLLDGDDLAAVLDQVPAGSRHEFQLFRPETALADALRLQPAGFDRSALRALAPSALSASA